MKRGKKDTELGYISLLLNQGETENFFKVFKINIYYAFRCVIPWSSCCSLSWHQQFTVCGICRRGRKHLLLQ